MHPHRPILTTCAVALALCLSPAHADEHAATIASADASTADTLLGHQLRRLHASEVVDLHQRYAGQPLLIVNTASHCGYTKQFKGLEALHQRFRERGLKVLGFSSNDFDQEADEEAKAAQVCFVNFGVSFDMYAPIHVRGDAAHPLFRELARQAEAPRWNFHKYVLGRDGRVIASFPSRTEPDAAEVIAAIETALASPAAGSLQR